VLSLTLEIISTHVLMSTAGLVSGAMLKLHVESSRQTSTENNLTAMNVLNTDVPLPPSFPRCLMSLPAGEDPSEPG
jgi:hypothetical protein